MYFNSNISPMYTIISTIIHLFVFVLLYWSCGAYHRPFPNFFFCPNAFTQNNNKIQNLSSKSPPIVTFVLTLPVVCSGSPSSLTSHKHCCSSSTSSIIPGYQGYPFTRLYREIRFIPSSSSSSS